MCQLTGILALERDLDILNIVSRPISRLVATQASSSIVDCGARPPNNTIPHYSSSWLVARADDDMDQLYYRSYHLFTSCNVF